MARLPAKVGAEPGRAALRPPRLGLHVKVGAAEPPRVRAPQRDAGRLLPSAALREPPEGLRAGTARTENQPLVGASHPPRATDG